MSIKKNKHGTESKVKKKVTSVVLHVNVSFNNTMVTTSDNCGNVLFITSSGKLGFRGSNKATTAAGSTVMKNALDKLNDYQVKIIDINFKGPGSQKEAMLKAALVSGFKITKIVDKTPIPHNGVRPPKRRRV